MISVGTTAVILLAAGEGRRFGGGKLTACLHGKPVISYVAEAARGVGCGWNYAVVPADPSDELKTAIGAEFEFVENANAQNGMSTSIVAGVEAARCSGAGAVLVLLGDMPLVSTAHLLRLIHHADHEQSGMSYSFAAGRRSPPAVFSDIWFDKLLAATGDSGARHLLQAAPEEASIAAEPGMLVDVDLKEDLSRLSGDT